MELISVIIPTKNRIDVLKRALQSVLKQTYSNYEVLVVDDKSEENVQETVASFDDPRIRYFLNTKSTSNANVCRNIGQNNAKGKYVAMLDSDDEWLPNHLSSKLQFLKVNNCDGVFGSAYVDDGEKRMLRLSRPRGENELMLDYLLTSGRAPTPTHFYKTECAKTIPWDEHLGRHQDFDFSARFAERFLFLACEDPTAIIHWKKGEKRTEDIPSQIRFFQKHSKNISPNVKVKYLTETYSKIANRIEIPKNQREFFSIQSLKYISFMSLADFSLISSKRGGLGKVLNRLEYVFRVLFTR